MRQLKIVVCAALLAAIAPVAFAQEGAATRKDYDCGGGKLVVWTEKDYEEQHVIVWFQDDEGNQIRPNMTAPGSFVPLCSRGAFLLLDDTWSHFMPGPSWLVSSTGEIFRRFELGNLVDHGHTSDEAVVWTQSMDYVDGNWRTHLRVFDPAGVILHDGVYTAAAQQQVVYKGRTHTIGVKQPHDPY